MRHCPLCRLLNFVHVSSFLFFKKHTHLNTKSMKRAFTFSSDDICDSKGFPDVSCSRKMTGLHKHPDRSAVDRSLCEITVLSVSAELQQQIPASSCFPQIFLELPFGSEPVMTDKTFSQACARVRASTLLNPSAERTCPY